jgi:hypothetical protein
MRKIREKISEILIGLSPVWVLLVLAFVIRFFVANQVGNCFILGTDETKYLEDLRHLNSSAWNSYSYTGFDGKWPILLKFIYSPSLLFLKLGFDYPISLRLTSILGFVLSGAILWTLLGGHKENEMVKKLLLVSYLFFPSLFGWTSMGLREGLLFFAISLIFLSFRQKSKFIDVFSVSQFLLGFTILFSLKFYLGLQLLVAFLFVFLLLKFANIESVITKIGLTGAILPLLISLVGSFIPISYSSVRPPTSNTSSSTILDAKQCIRNEAGGIFRPIIAKVANLDSPEIKQSDPLYELHATDLYSSDSKLRPPSNTLLRSFLTLPKGIFIFLLNPLPFVNQHSKIMALVSWEILFWFIFYFSTACILFFSILKKIQPSRIYLIALGFIGIFVCMSALVEINLGTIFRHRSIILLPGLILIGEYLDSKPKFEKS